MFTTLNSVCVTSDYASFSLERDFENTSGVLGKYVLIRFNLKNYCISSLVFVMFAIFILLPITFDAYRLAWSAKYFSLLTFVCCVLIRCTVFQIPATLWSSTYIKRLRDVSLVNYISPLPRTSDVVSCLPLCPKNWGANTMSSPCPSAKTTKSRSVITGDLRYI